MSSETVQLVSVFGVFIVLMFMVGVYAMIVTRNLIRVLIGIEILTKAATLLMVLAGYATGRMALAQSLVITMIAIEVVVIAVAVGIVIGVFKRNHSLDARNLRNLKG